MKNKLSIMAVLICALAASYTGMAQGFIGNGVSGGAGIEAVTTTGTNAVNVAIGAAATSSSAVTLQVTPPPLSTLGLEFDNLPLVSVPTYYLTYDLTSNLVSYSPPPMATVSSVTINCDGTITVNGTTSTDGAWRTDGNVVGTTAFLGSIDDNDVRIVTNNGGVSSCPGVTYNNKEQKMIIGSDANNGNVEIGWDGITAIPIPTGFGKFTVQNGTVATNPYSSFPLSPSDVGIYAYANQSTSPDNYNIGIVSVADNLVTPAQNSLGFATVIENSTVSNMGMFMNISSASSSISNTGVSGNIVGDGDNNRGFSFSVEGNNSTNTGASISVGQSTTTTVTNTGISMNVGGSNITNRGVDVSIIANNGSNLPLFQNAGASFTVTGNSTNSTATGINWGVISKVSGNNIFDVGVNGNANGNDAGNVTGVYGTAFGTNTLASAILPENFGVHGRILSNSGSNNPGTICIGVYGDIDNGADGKYNYGVCGDFRLLNTTSTGTAYYAVYGIAANNGAGSGVAGSTPGSTSTSPPSYAGYFEGDVFCSQTYFYSDPKLKENIQRYTGALDQIKKLPIKSYTFRNSEFPKMNLPVGDQVGVLSTDMKAVFPNLVKGGVHPGNQKTGDREVTFDAVNYNALIPVLVEAVQELDAKTTANPATDDLAKTIASQQAQIAAQSQQLTEQSKQIAELRTMIDDLCSTGCAGFKPNTNPAGLSPAVSGSAVLYQSTPNPTSGSAVIAYAINMPFTTATIQVSDKGGKLIRQYAIQQQGAGSVTFEGSAIAAAGSYTYSLIIDGRVYDTKTMVIVKD